jgi:hypothetical protein
LTIGTLFLSAHSNNIIIHVQRFQAVSTTNSKKRSITGNGAPPKRIIEGFLVVVVDSTAKGAVAKLKPFGAKVTEISLSKIKLVRVGGPPTKRARNINPHCLAMTALKSLANLKFLTMIIRHKA